MKTYDRDKVLSVSAQLVAAVLRHPEAPIKLDRAVHMAKDLIDEVERQCPLPGKPKLPTYAGQPLELFRISPEEEALERRVEEMKRASREESARLRSEWREQTVYVVEATDTEHQFLWERYHMMVKWEQLNPGEIATLGHLKKKPLCVDIRWARIDNQIVMFYYPSSAIIDWSWVKNWVNQEYKGREHCNAANFHNCLSSLRRNTTAKANKPA